ncbi:hypothetical protein PACTADRAFT_73650 [Pachysolen tannophilus NRRL Y-2460]|uniref:Amino acid transporter transmembrane domain-containing protein n=1 Tax=Pachysolen tannophilus NRRL Y-2460 TaxID=669874 RepID=A0A1E4U1X1_PACTA|nr:hypothetical protein PACTADRAFT_73650 [Pachysolen tannophilus NRRL Y-2460]
MSPRYDNDNLQQPEAEEDEENLNAYELESLDSLDFGNEDATMIPDVESNNTNHEANHFSENQNKSTMRMAFMNMANSILGAGIIGLPFAFRNCGLLAGIVMLVVLTVLIDWTLRLIIINNKLSSQKSYHDTVEFCFGKTGRMVILLAQGLFAYGGSMAFCVIIGDSIPHVLRSFFAKFVESSKFIDVLLSRNVVIIGFTIGIAYPLSMNRDISKLAKASMFALIGMLVIVAIVTIRGPIVSSTVKVNFTTSDIIMKSSIFQGISVISFALVCHHNTTFIYDSMKNPTLDRFTKLTHISCFISMLACAVMGLAGFLSFKDKTKGNILNNFPSDDFAVNIARFFFGLNMLTTLPLEIFVVREIVKEILLPEGKVEGTNKKIVLSDRAHFIITSLLVFSSMSVSLFTCNLGAILELIGATSASLMAYILPPLCYAKMIGAEKSTMQKLPAYSCAAFGFLVMGFSTIQTISGAIHGTDASHCVID